MQFLERLAPLTLSLLRVVAGLLFAQHGFQKLLGWFGGQIAPPFSLFWFAGVMEAAGGPLIALGLFTRPVALLLAGEMVAAYFMAHQPVALMPLENRGSLALQFGLIFLHLASAGGGSVALDSLWRRESGLDKVLGRFQALSFTLLRVGAGFLFFEYGARKIFGWYGGRLAEAGSRLWFAGMMEVIGGPLLALGLLTIPAAFLLSGEMAVAYGSSHFPRGFWPVQNGGEPSALFCFIYLYFFTAGPGKISLDRLLFKRFQ